MAWPRSLDRKAADTPVTVAAWGATIAWLLISALVFFGMAGGEAGLDPLRVMMVPVAVFGPVALIWIAAFLTRRVSALARAVNRLDRGDSADLAQRLDALARGQAEIRAALPRAAAGAPAAADPPRGPEAAPDRPASPPRRARRSAAERSRTEPPEAAPPEPPGADPAGPAPHRTDPQPDPAEAEAAPRLDLAEAESERPLDPDTLIRALQFPADAEDEEGFRALRQARRDRAAAQVVTAAQDLLTLLSENGLYMDDVEPAPAGAEVWRGFADGARGAAVAEIGGAGTAETEARISERLRSDAIFRDAAHHFLRLFDRLLSERAPALSDADLEALSATRSARAFALLGRSLGTFD